MKAQRRKSQILRSIYDVAWAGRNRDDYFLAIVTAVILRSLCGRQIK
jgi:hypothetical protein